MRLRALRNFIDKAQMRCKFLAVYKINYRLDEKTFPRAGRVGVSPCELCRLNDSSEIHFVHIIYVHVLSDIIALVAWLVDNLAAPITRGIYFTMPCVPEEELN